MTSPGKPGLDFPGVGAGLVILRDEKLLLCRRVKAPEAEHWSIPGGKVDHMEPAHIAAKREAEEETGLTIGQVDFLCHSELALASDNQHWVSLIYLARDFQGEPTLTEPDKLSEIGWFALDQLPEPLSAFAKDALTALKHHPVHQSY